MAEAPNFFARYGRLRRLQADTGRGLMLTGLVSGGLLLGLSGVISGSRPMGEPLLKTMLTLASIIARTPLRYDPRLYYGYAGFIALAGVACGLTGLLLARRKPSEDHRIQDALERRITPTARGAPIER